MCRFASCCVTSKFPSSLALQQNFKGSSMPNFQFLFCRTCCKRRLVAPDSLVHLCTSCIGLGYFYLWCHTPYGCDNYDHFAESPLFLFASGLAELHTAHRGVEHYGDRFGLTEIKRVCGSPESETEMLMPGRARGVDSGKAARHIRQRKQRGQCITWGEGGQARPWLSP